MVDRQHSGGLEELVQRAAPLGPQPALLGWRQRIDGQPEADEFGEHTPDSLDPFQQCGTCGAERRHAALRRAHHVERMLEQVPALALALAMAPGGDQRQALDPHEPMALDAVGDGVLLVVWDGAHRMRERRPDRAEIHASLQRWRQTARQHEPSVDPAPLAVARPGDGGDAEAILGAHRLQHPRLVHRRHAARRRVAGEQHLLRFGGRASPLDHDWHGHSARRTPATQSLEAVDDLEPAVVGADDAQWHLAQRWSRAPLRRCGRGSQLREARAELIRRHQQDLGHDAGRRRRRAASCRCAHHRLTRRRATARPGR